MSKKTLEVCLNISSPILEEMNAPRVAAKVEQRLSAMLPNVTVTVSLASGERYGRAFTLEGSACESASVDCLKVTDVVLMTLCPEAGML
jgi:hypothetical protein